MKSNISIFTATILTAVLSQSALAGSDSGFYLGGSVGSAQLSFDSFDDYIDDSDTGYKFFAGYNFGLLPMVDIALEGSYVDFGSQYGELFDDTTRFSNTAAQLHLVGGLDLGPVGLFAKAGLSDWETTFTNGDYRAKATGSDPAYGIGAKFQVASFQLRAEYERVKLDDADMDFYSIGAAYTF
ncbi:porin family protein [Simiduia curdlanivorans]|uniref:Porin family protein n=1 Tax=Simiduia curdlanivorans TaxID=1492769 RepID=A0ABV8V3B4_9GAMM|nr:porin family protein [Simiduia curdlanivorans]MDN3638293.1 porin family protein [Simiduia curdlanivorans]